MKYFEWNIAIGNYFFNYEKAGKEILLFISPLEIGEIGIKSFGFVSKEEALADLYDAMCYGYAGFTKAEPISKRVEILFDSWNKSRLEYSNQIEQILNLTVHLLPTKRLILRILSI